MQIWQPRSMYAYVVYVQNFGFQRKEQRLLLRRIRNCDPSGEMQEPRTANHTTKSRADTSTTCALQP